MREVLGQIDPVWHPAFLSFVETGEAGPDFMEFLDQDRACQEAVEKVFLDQAAALQRLGRALRGAKP